MIHSIKTYICQEYKGYTSGKMQLTQKVIDFLLAIKENKGMITKGDQKMYGSVSYYIMIGYLSSIGLVYCNGFNDKNQKKWIFTPLGEKITEHLYQIRELYENANGKGNRKKT
jgi:predicted transcriptional regulator